MSVCHERQNLLIFKPLTKWISRFGKEINGWKRKQNGFSLRQWISLYFDKRILDSCKFISDEVDKGLIYSNLFLAAGMQSINWYHSACMEDSTVSIFLVSGKREGRERVREREGEINPSFSSLSFSYFPSRVYCHVIPHRVLFNHKKLEKVVYEPDCSELPWYLMIYDQ